MNSHNPAGSSEQSPSNLQRRASQAQWLIGCYLYFNHKLSCQDDSTNLLAPLALCISTGIMYYTNADTISNTACTLFNKGMKFAKEVMEKRNNANVNATVESNAPACRK